MDRLNSNFHRVPVTSNRMVETAWWFPTQYRESQVARRRRRRRRDVSGDDSYEYCIHLTWMVDYYE